MATIAITGGTGSFGQALVNHIIGPGWSHFDKIVIYSRDEQKQDKMRAAINDPFSKLRFRLGDVRDLERTRVALRDANYVIHAAALKIVPMGESNPSEFVKTNTLGTMNVLEAIGANKWCDKMIMLSTDKAAMPINLYGATKLAAEKLTLAHNNVHAELGPKCSVVRYGNVANSNGSVIPVFLDQYRRGVPFTITDPDMTRYWITLEDAVDFVLKSMQKMEGGEVFIPKMPSFLVMDLMYAFKGNWGYNITGKRPGEKLHETIDGINYSDKNDTWMDSEELRRQLFELGVIGQ